MKRYSTHTTSHPLLPRSTKSPLKRYQFFSLGRPLMEKMVKRSCSCPCVSPTIVSLMPSGILIRRSVGSLVMCLRARSRTSMRYL